EALHHMHAAESLINSAKQENSSLERYYGYSLQIICQELIRFSDNAAGYLGKNTNLLEIIEDEGNTWHTVEIREKRKRRNTENTPNKEAHRPKGLKGH